jgi:hypothetical protein
MGRHGRGHPGTPGAAVARCAAALVALAALLPAAQCGAPTMWLQPLVDIDPLAVCNDGSPAGYYFIEGTTQANVWLIYLEGGMWCARPFVSASLPQPPREREAAQRHLLCSGTDECATRVGAR